MAAVASRSTNNSPHLNPRMSSPKDTKRNLALKSDDTETQRRESPLHNSQDARQSPPSRTEPQDPVASTDFAHSDGDQKPVTTAATTNAAPFAPPPRPAPQDAPDYFNQIHNSSHFNVEPNPFEHAFGGSSAETPGKGLLPSVASLTSPSSLLPGGTPGWPNSLRSGPLSPAMLTGPTGTNDYFGDPHFRGGFPTPNESSLRTGLTPGGGGSMFPAPSPNSQALFNSLQSGGATPSTLDFHRTALSAAAKANHFNGANNGPTSQPTDQNAHHGMDQKHYQPQQPQQQGQQDPFGQHDANDAANGLFLLAQANGVRNANQFAVPGQPAHAIQTNMGHMPNHMGGQSQDTSPASRRATKNSIGSMAGSAETGDFSESGHSEQAKPATRSRGKKGSTGKAANNNGRRKAAETPSKAPANKKAKSNNGNAFNQDIDMDMDMGASDEEQSPKQETDANGKKMTDEEKRKNFLERNRVAALKCRQRKKQWLANLQTKVELFSTENDALSATVTQLREEIVNLKTLLIAHKDCPVSAAQGLGGMNMNAFVDSIGHHAHPYGMGLPPNGAPPGMQMQMSGQGPPQGQPGMQRR